MYVYVSGPLTQGDSVRNANDAVMAGNELAEAGHVPFVPHLYLFWQYLAPQSYEFWMHQCMCWLVRCSAIIRLPGESEGADREVAEARDRGIPVYGSVADFLVAH